MSDWARYDETVDGNVLDGSSSDGADNWSIDDGAPTSRLLENARVVWICEAREIEKET